MTKKPTVVLEAADMTVRFRARGRRRSTLALDGVGVRVERGRTTGLVGESGAGKTTLAKAVLGLVPMAAGSVRFLGTEISGLAPARRRGLGNRLQAVYQDPLSSLNPSYSVSWSLAEPMRAHGRRDREEVAARVAATLESVEIDPATARRRPHAFSGGQLQRICIARAIITSPDLVILDEAVSALDLSVQAQILNLLRDIQEERDLSYLFISHDLAVVRHFCHDMTVLYRGQVMETGSAVDVADSPAHPYTRALMQASPVADPVVQRKRRLAESTKAVRVTATPSHGCVYAPRCPFAAPECHQLRPELREISPGRAVACHRYPMWIEEIEDRL